MQHVLTSVVSSDAIHAVFFAIGINKEGELRAECGLIVLIAHKYKPAFLAEVAEGNLIDVGVLEMRVHLDCSVVGFDQARVEIYFSVWDSRRKSGAHKNNNINN